MLVYQRVSDQGSEMHLVVQVRKCESLAIADEEKGGLQSLPSGQWLDYEKNLGRFFCGFGWKWFIGPKKKWDKPSINHPPVITILMVV